MTDNEIREYRQLFPVTEKFIYLDHAGVSPVSLRSVNKVNEFLSEASQFGISKHDYFMEGVENARSDVSKLINSNPNEIAFVRNTSHGLSLVARGIKWDEGDNIIIFENEFPANVYIWMDLEDIGVEVRKIPIKNNSIDYSQLEKSIDDKTRLLSISSVQYYSGFKADLDIIGNICRGNNVYFCVDAIQSLGVVPMDVKALNIDFLAADGHKWLLSPEGTGFLYCREDICEELKPVLLGWKSVINESDYENIDLSLKTDALRFEEGSFNVMGIFALGAGIELLLEIGINNIYKRVQCMGELIMDKAKSRKFEINTPSNKEDRGGIVSFSGQFDPILLKDKLYKHNILVNVRHQAIRVAPHFYNTEGELDNLFSDIDDIL